METGLRIFLLVLAAFVLVGIVWDLKTSRHLSKLLAYCRGSRKKKEALAGIDEDFSEEMQAQVLASQKTFESVVLQKTKPTLQPVMLYIMARKNQGFSGQRLLQVFKDERLTYGEHHIFHRREPDLRKTLFSVASAVEPGTFILSDMRQFITPGIVLFFDPNASESVLKDFEQMLRTARRLTVALDGQLKDQQHQVLTVQMLEDYERQIKAINIT